MSQGDVLYVKQCWGVFHKDNRRTLVAYPSESEAIRHALGTADRTEVVVLNLAGKVTEHWTKAAQ